MKAQVSVEFMIIFGIALGFAIPVWIYVYSMQQSAGEELSISYAKNAASQIASASDLVYTQGPPAKVRLNVYIPSKTEVINITGKEIIFRMASSAGFSDVFSISLAELNGTLSISEGMRWISVESKGDFVQITEE
jgi:hypothetical protein